MNRSIVGMVVLTLGGIGVYWPTNMADAQRPDPPASAAAATDLQVRFADARHRLARVEVEIALELNRKVGGTVSKREFRRLEANVDVASKQLVIAKEFTHGSAPSTQLTAADTAAKLADQDLQSASAAHKRNPQTISKIMVRRASIKLEMAKIRVELWQDPAYLPSLMDEMQWQIDRLTEQVIELTQRLDAREGRLGK